MPPRPTIKARAVRPVQASAEPKQTAIARPVPSQAPNRELRGTPSARPLSVAGTQAGLQPASFGARAAAAFIDFLILNVLMSIVNLAFMSVLALGLDMTTIMIATVGPILAEGLLTMFYCVWLESSGWQGTIGKRALGLKVVDLGGQRISFWRSSSRNFGKSISMLLLGLGYLMPLWSRNKQALHDRMAKCLVVRRHPLRQSVIR